MSVAFGALVNLVGFVAGLALYAMLLVMSLQAWRELRASGGRPDATLAGGASDSLWIATGLLGLVWNVGAIVFYGLTDLGLHSRPAWLVAAAFGALGLLPAVVVHSVLREWRPAGRVLVSRALMIAGYAIGTAGAVLHAAGAAHGDVPSRLALQMVTIGFAALVVPLAVATRRQAGWQRALWMLALALFAVSALHLTHHAQAGNPVWLELVGHHASLPLALAVLYQDYPFALGDLLLKRALAFVVLLTVGFFALGGLALLTTEPGGAAPGAFSDPRLIAGLLAIIVFTALAYPGIRRAISWIVDRALLGRVDYASLVAALAVRLDRLDSEPAVLEEAARQLRDALGASRVDWTLTWEPADGGPVPTSGGTGARSPESGATGSRPQPTRHAGPLLAAAHPGRTTEVPVPTTDGPRPALAIGRLRGGRRLLSDDTSLIRDVAALAARRIDAIRLANERFARRYREQELGRLATEAELRALRARLHPHFLFNALTTIGYLIQTAPPRAFDTLMRLTTLLRHVLRSEGEEATLGSELDVVVAYLDIERARFEERLTVHVSVPEVLRDLAIPVFVVQPLVENAIKHGIAPARAGGSVRVEAALVESGPGEIDLRLRVADTGRGADAEEIAAGRRRGTGLATLERRLKLARGERARVEVRSVPGAGTVVDVLVPLPPGTAAALVERGVPIERAGDADRASASPVGAIVPAEGGRP